MMVNWKVHRLMSYDVDDFLPMDPTTVTLEDDHKGDYVEK